MQRASLTGVLMIVLAPVAAAEPLRWDASSDRRFPPCRAVVDVTQAPYLARGDGKTDDTQALQRALDDVVGSRRILYFPAGVYLISRTLEWKNRTPQGQNAYGFTWLQGENPMRCTLKLADRTFTDAAKPRAMMWCGGFGSADWFHNYVQGLTFDTGTGNPGAVGLQFYSNNTGAVRDCRVLSGDGGGQAGLDLGHRDMNGPLLVQRVQVRGFRVGIACARAVNSQTLERIELSDQGEFGLDNHGQALSVRGLRSRNRVPAVRSYGTLTLLDADLQGTGEAADLPAVVNYNGGRLAARDLEARGYRRAIADVATPDFAAALRVTGEDKPGSLGPKVPEYHSHPATQPFDGPARSLRLEVRETPDLPWGKPDAWANVDAFGADPTGQKDSSAALQKAIDSGAETVFCPGSYALQTPVVLRGKVRRLLGAGGWLDYNGRSKPDLIVGDGAGDLVAIEHFAPISGGVRVTGTRDVVIRSCESRRVEHAGTGRLFLEDVSTDDLRLGKGQRLWARQLNIENEGTHLTNAGGEVWVLGYKTERGGTLLHTRDGGRSELFGTFSYTTTAGKLAPMFVTEDAEVYAFFSEVCYNHDPFTRLIRETRGKVTREVLRDSGKGTWPYIGRRPGE